MNRLGAFLRIVLAIQLALPAQLLCWAGQALASEGQPAVDPSAQVANVTQNVPVNLDLTSTERSQTVSTKTVFDSATIQVGSVTRTITPGLAVTPAEYVAVMQVLKTGQQSIQLGDMGNAVGGTLNLSWLGGRAVDNLVVPTGVSALNDFARTASLNVLGNLNNSGNIYAYSTNNQVNNAVVNAGNIFNNTSATISSVLPAGGLGVQSAIASLNLSLNAVHDIVNAGSIISSGNLSMTAGGSIVNSAPAGMTALLQAASNVNLQAANTVNQGTIAAQLGNLNASTAALINSGVIQSVTGNVSIQNLIGNTLSVKNTGGLISAGDKILIETLATTFDSGNNVLAKAGLSVAGGGLAGREISFVCPDGIVNVHADRLSGRVNVSAGAAEVGQQSGGSLELGDMTITGDPTFYNVGGNVVINGNLSFAGAPLAIIAGGDILTGPSAGTISTANGSGSGGAITMLAGVQFTSTGATAVLPTGSGDTTSTLTITGGSTIGGKIDLSGGGAISSLTSQSTGGGGSGGAITLGAFAGTTQGSGTITLPSAVTIDAGGNGPGSNGAVVLAAGATSGTGISVGNVSTTGGTGGGGGISILTQTPSVTNPIIILNGAIIGGTGGFGATQAASISTGALTAPGAAIVVISGANLATGAITSNGVTGAAGGAITLSMNSATSFNIGGGGVNGTTGAISANAASGAGGAISITNSGSAGITLGSSAIISATAAGTGKGGTITLDALGTGTAGTLAFTTGAITISANGSGSAAGGEITLKGASVTNTSGLLTLSANAGTTGAGGTVTVTETATTSDISVSNSGAGNMSISARGGTTSGAGGTIKLTAGRNLSVANVAGLNASPFSGAGGTYELTGGASAAGTVLISGALSADAVTGGAGGVIRITSNSSTTFNVGAAGTNGTTGALTARAVSSGAGGVVEIFNRGSGGITHATTANLNVAALGTGKGGVLTLDASSNGGTGTLTFTGAITLSTNGVGAAGGGDITLRGNAISNTSGLLTLSAIAGTVGTGGNITVVTVGNTSDLSISGSGSNNMSLNTKGGTTSGAGGSLSVSAGRNLTVSSTAGLNATATSGSSGNYYFASGMSAGVAGNISFASTLGLSANATTGGSGGVVSLDATGNGASGNLLFSGSSATTFTANGVGTGAGGKIILKGATISNSGGLLTLNANAGSTGVGGEVTVSTYSNTSSISISGSGANNIAITANGGTSSGAGGTVTIAAGDDLTISSQSSMATTVVNGNGGSYILSAGNTSTDGTVQITGGLNANGAGTGNGGLVSITAKSTTSFNIGGGGSNGTTSSITANASGNGDGGEIIIRNQGAGGITHSTSSNLSASATGNGKGGRLTLDAAYNNTTGTLAIGSNVDFDYRGQNNGAGGYVYLRGASISTGTKTDILVDAGAGSNVEGGTATIITTGSGSDINLNDSNFGTISQNRFDISARGGQNSGKGGVIILSAADDISVTDPNNSMDARPFNGNGGEYYLTSGTVDTNGDLTVSAGIRAQAVGTGSGGKAYLVANGNIDVGAGISAAAATNGDGGEISIISSSSTNFVLDGSGANRVNGDLDAFAVGTGSGGTVIVKNLGSGGITDNASNNIDVAASTNGKGGTIILDAVGSALTLGAITFTALGVGDGNGGKVTLAGGALTTSGALTVNAGAAGTGSADDQAITVNVASLALSGLMTLNADANGTSGKGGGIAVTTTGATADININSSGNVIKATALGGSSSGGGGTLTLSAGRNVVVNSAGVTIGPQAGNSNGATFNLIAGTGASTGFVQWTGALSASALGSGTAGNASISYKDTAAGNTFQVGGTGTNSYVSGALTANAPGSGTPGTVAIANTSAATGTRLDIAGTIATSSTGSGTLGAVNVTSSGGPVVVSVGASGVLTGALGATGTAVTITGRGPLVLNNVAASSGAVSITAQAGATPTVTLNNGSTISATGGSVTINTPGLTNSGTITSSGTGNAVTLNNASGAFSMSGLGHVQTAGGAIAVGALSGNALALNASQTYSGGTLTYSAAGAAGSLTIGAGVVQTMLSNNIVNVNTVQVTMSRDSQFNGSGMTSQAVNFNGDASNGLNIKAPVGFTSAISTSGGQINFTMPATKPLTFDIGAGAGVTTLNINGGPVVTTTSSTTTVNANVTVATNNSITFNVNGSTFTNNGTVSAAIAGTNITVQSTSGLTLAGAGSFVNNATGTTAFLAMVAGSTLTVSNGTTYSIGGNGGVSIRTPNLTFAASSASPSITATGTSLITVNSGNSASNVNLTIRVPSGFAGALATSSISSQAILITPTGSGTLTFADSGASNTTLNLNTGSNGTVNIAAGNTITIDPRVTLATNNNFQFDVNGARLTNNGSVDATTPSRNITVQSTSNLTLAGSPSSGLVSFVGNATGTTSFLAMGAGNSITIADAAALTIGGAVPVLVRTPNLIFAASSTSPSLTATGASTVTVNSGNSATNVNLTITAPSGFAGTIGSGGSINIAPTGTGSLTFADSGASPTTLNLNGNTQISAASAQINVNMNVTIATNNNITFTTTGGTSGSTTSDILINGNVQSSSPTGIITMQSSTNLSVGPTGGLSADKLNLSTTSGNNGNITLDSNITGTTSVTISANGSGNINFRDTTIATITGVGVNPKGVSMSPDRRYVYVSAQNNDTVTTIDTTTNTIVAVENLNEHNPPIQPVYPLGIAVSPNGLKAYVADNGNTTNNQTTVQILDLSNPAQPDVLPNTVTVGNNPHSIVFTPDGRYAYVTNQGLNGQVPGTPSTVSVIDTTTDTVVSTITVGGMPKGLAVNPSGTAVYVANEQSNTVSVIDTALAISNPSAAVVATIPVGTTPRGVAANPAGLWVYVTNQGSNTMSIIDTSSNTVIATVAVGPNPAAVAVNQSGTLAYIPNQGNNTVSVVSTGAFLEIATPSSGAAPFPTGNFLGFIGVNNFAYIPNGGANSVSVLRFPTIVTPSLTLTSTSGLINASTNATSYSANTTGNVYLTASNNITAVNPPSGTPQNTGNIYQVGTPLNLTVNSPINANVVILQNVLTNSLISVAQNIIASGTVNSPSAGPPAGNPPQYSALFIVAGGGSLINTAAITSTSTGLTDAIQVQGQGALTLSGVGTFAPGVGHNVFIGAPVSLTVSGTTNQVSTNGNVVIQTPIVQGANLGNGIVAASAGTISVNSNFNNTANLLFRPVTAGQTSTVNLNAGQVFLNSFNLSVNSALNVASTGTITANMGGTLLTNNGTFSSSATGGATVNGVVVSFVTLGALTVAGNGSYSLSGAAVSGVIPQVQFATSGANALQVTGSNTFALGVGGVNFLSQATGASLTFASGTTQTMTTGGYIYVSSPTLNLPTGTVFNQSAAAGATIAIDGGNPTSTFNLNLPSGTINFLSGSFGTTIYPYNWNQAMNISSAGTTTLNINGGPVLFYTYGANQTIGSGVTIQSNDNIEFDLVGGGGQLTVNGSILVTNASKQLTFFGLGGGTITFAGTPQTIGGGTQSILLEADSMVFNSSYTFNASNGLVSILTPANNTGSITLANNVTVKADGNSRLSMGATLLSLGTNSTIWSTATSGTAIDLNYIAPNNSGNMTLSLPGGSNTIVNLQSNGGLVSLRASGSMTFANPNGGTTTLNVTGGSFFAENSATAMTIATGLTVRGSSNMTFSLTNDSQFIDNGTITSTGSGSTIRIQGGGATTTGNFVMAGTPQTITAPGGGSVVLQGFRPLVINSSYTFSTSGGSLTLSSPQSVTLASSVTVQMSGSGQVFLNTPVISFGAGSTISTGQTSGTGITAGIGFSNLTINVPGSGIGTFLTSGASVNLVGATGMTLARNGGSGTATLRLNGGPAAASVNSGTLSVGSNFSLTSNAALTLNAPFATVSNSGTISGTAATGSTSTTVNASALSNTGTITGSSGANLVVTNTGGGNLTVTGSGALTAVGSTSTVTISNSNGSVNASQGQISGRVIGTSRLGYTLTTTSGSSLTVGNITASQGSVTVTAGTPGSSTVLTVAGGSTINAFEGNVTLMNSDTTTGSIVIGAAATSTLINAFTASNNLSIGNVYVVVGAIPVSPTNLDPVGRPANVTVNIVGGGKTTPGQVYWGASSITVNNPSTVNAFARTALFNSTLGANSIRLNGAVTIVADPPIPGAQIIFAVLEPQSVVAQAQTISMPPISVGMNNTSITSLDTLSGTSAKWYESGDSLNNPVATDLQNKEERKSDENWLGSTDSEESADSAGDSEGLWQDEAESPLQPISFVAPGGNPNQASPLMLHTLETSSGLLKHTGRARISHESDRGMIILHSGETLLAASRQMDVKCGQIKVSVQKGSYVLMSRQGKVLKVRNLHESSANSVKVIVRDKYVHLSAGQELILSTSDEQLAKASKQDAIGRRRVKAIPLADGVKMVRSEISLVSLMRKNGTLSTMLRSSDAVDKKIAGRVVKMAACLMYSSSSHGAYSTLP